MWHSEPQTAAQPMLGKEHPVESLGNPQCTQYWWQGEGEREGEPGPLKQLNCAVEALQFCISLRHILY